MFYGRRIYARGERANLDTYHAKLGVGQYLHSIKLLFERANIVVLLEYQLGRGECVYVQEEALLLELLKKREGFSGRASFRGRYVRKEERANKFRGS